MSDRIALLSIDYLAEYMKQVTALRAKLAEREAYIVVLERQREEASKAMGLGLKFQSDAIAKIRELRAELGHLGEGGRVWWEVRHASRPSTFWDKEKAEEYLSELSGYVLPFYLVEVTKFERVVAVKRDGVISRT